MSANATPKKPALIHQLNHERKSDRHIVWDEQAISEHDELRGTRTKIDEPKTPFHHDYADGASAEGSFVASDDAAVAMQWEALHEKLHEYSQEQQLSSDAQNDSHSTGSFEGDGETRKKPHDHEEFEKHRKDHYKEYEVLKRFRENNPCLDDEEEDSKSADVVM